jgi:hypothetical protein
MGDCKLETGDGSQETGFQMPYFHIQSSAFHIPHCPLSLISSVCSVFFVAKSFSAFPPLLKHIPHSTFAIPHLDHSAFISRFS